MQRARFSGILADNISNLYRVSNMEQRKGPNQNLVTNRKVVVDVFLRIFLGRRLYVRRNRNCNCGGGKLQVERKSMHRVGDTVCWLEAGRVAQVDGEVRRMLSDRQNLRCPYDICPAIVRLATQ